MTEHYFFSDEAAARYERFRPQVHSVALDWLAKHNVAGPYGRALDIGCGTGQSMSPLLAVARVVDGIDSSSEMVALATMKGLRAQVAGIHDVAVGAYDLISISMAFHWFDRADLIRAMMAASTPRATWLVYNFWLAGHQTDVAFNNWLQTWYREHFPSPPRGSTSLQPTPDEPGLSLLAFERGQLHVPFDRFTLIGYLTTQSNVEAGLKPGFGYGEAEALLQEAVPMVADSEGYLYGYEYTICRLDAA